MAGFFKDLAGEKTSMIYLAFLRIYIGYYFLAAGINKLSGGFLSKPILAGILKGWAEKNPHWWYKDFLIETAIPNADLFSYLVVTGEIAVGGLLIAGLMTRAAALAGIFMNLNFYFASGWTAPASSGINRLFIVCQAVLLLTGAGRALGVDAFLKKAAPKSVLW